MKASGRWGDQVLRADIKSKLPADGSDKRAAPLEFTIDAPGLLQDALTGRAEVGANGTVLTVNSLTGAVGKSRFNGQASVDFADKPAVRLNLDLQRIDLAVANAGVSTNAAPPAGVDQPWSDKPINLDWLNFLDAEMQITAADLRIDRFRFAPASVGVILTNGVLTTGWCAPASMADRFRARLSSTPRSAEPSHALRVDLTGVRALPLLSDVACFDGIDGRMQAKIDARGRGTNPRAIMSTLYGAVDLSVQDGELRSVNIAKMIRFVAASTLSGWQENKAEKTDLTELSAFFRIEGGQASTDNLRLLGPLVRVTGAGTADLGGEDACSSGSSRSSCSVSKGRAAPPIRSASAYRLWCRGLGARRASTRRWPVSWTTPKRPTPSFESWDTDCSGLSPGQSGIAGNRAAAEHRCLDRSPRRRSQDRDRSGEYRKTTASLADAVAGRTATATAAGAAAAPQPAPPPAQSSQSQSSSQSPSLLRDGPIEFFKKLFGK